MKIFSLFFLIFVPLSLLGAYTPIPVDEGALRQKFKDPSYVVGPNCYNTAFLSLGYFKEVVHISNDEARFYLKNFCEKTDLSIPEAQSGALIVFYNRKDEALEHIATSLGRGLILEKANLLAYFPIFSSKKATPGVYYFHDFSKSDYIAMQHFVFHCASAEEVQQRLAGVSRDGVVRELLKMRMQLAEDLPPVRVDNLEVFLRDKGLVYLRSLKMILQRARPDSELSREYIYALSATLMNQIYYMTYYSDPWSRTVPANAEEVLTEWKEISELRKQKFSVSL